MLVEHFLAASVEKLVAVSGGGFLLSGGAFLLSGGGFI
jgi:hypothetical protein